MIIYITQWGRLVTRNWPRVTRNCQHDGLTVEKLAADCLDVRNRCLSNWPLGTASKISIIVG